MHKPSLDRVKEGGVSGEGLLNLFKDLISDAKVLKQETMCLTVWFGDEKDKFEPGTYVPELHLIVRKVEEQE